MVIVIAVIAILAAVLIPTFGGVVDKANASAAYQEAKNAWTEYLAEVDYVTETAEDTAIIVVDKGDVFYTVNVTGGKIDTKAEKGTGDTYSPATGLEVLVSGTGAEAKLENANVTIYYTPQA